MTRINDAMLRLMARFERGADEDGQGMAEYGLILALVAVLLVAAFTGLKTGIANTLSSVTSSL